MVDSDPRHGQGYVGVWAEGKDLDYLRLSLDLKISPRIPTRGLFDGTTVVPDVPRERSSGLRVVALPFPETIGTGESTGVESVSVVRVRSWGGPTVLFDGGSHKRVGWVRPGSP